MRKFVLCIVATITVMAAAIADKALLSPRQQAQLTAADAQSAGQPSAPAATRTALGPAIPLAHGLVQVRVTAIGSRIVDVQAVQLPHDNDHSWLDSQHAATVLRSEVLSRQTTDLHAVSGATYTSEGYLESLNAALELAAPPAPKMAPTPLAP
jgi:uncharacterized protein with FMN-binding domain